jgi:hypothetical protein
MQLLSAFWTRQHTSGPVVYRTAFMRDMVCDGLSFAPLLLKAILFVATKDVPSMADQCSADSSCGDGMTFRAQVEDELYSRHGRILMKSKVTTVQALLLMSDALYSWCDEKDVAWHYLGLAINMICDLGLHTEHSKYYRLGSLEDQEIGRRVFWSAYGKFSLLHSVMTRINHGCSA